MQTGQELFIHGITDLLDAEQRLVKALTELERDSRNPDLKKGFGEHKRQTEQHVKRIQEVFKSIGQPPQATVCKGIQGLIEERESFKRDEDASPDILDIFDCGAAIKVETYEICAYNSVISLAEQLDLEEVIDLLQQNLSDEEEALEKMQDIQDQLEPEELGSSEEEDDEADEEEDEDEEEEDDDEDEDEDEEDAEDHQPKKSSRKKSPPKAPQKGKSKRVA